ncbi:MAG: glycosyltransferase family 4 protein [Aureispira sp.]|nr:glycosyltransferase family 4 protein [Aureispira sp.]
MLEQKSLRIAVVVNSAWNIYNYRLGLIEALLAQGYSVWAIAPTDDFVPQIEATGCQFIPLQRLSRKGTNPIQDLRLTHELYRIYRDQEIDIALQYTIKPNIYGSFACRFVKTKGVCTVTGLGYSFLSNGVVNKVVKRLYKQAFKRASLVAFQNNDDLKLFNDLKLLEEEKSTLIKGSGIKTNYFKPLPKTETTEDTVFLFVGRLLYDKGIVEYLEAAKAIKSKNPKTQFWIVGALDNDNPSAISPEIIDEYHKEGIINYIGQSSDVRSIMQNSDIVVLPSYREGLPRVMLEGLAMAKPLITTDTAGCRETVKDGVNGYIVPIKDREALVEAMQRMLNLSLNEREKMGQEGRKMAIEEFDEQAIIQRYFDEIKKLSS